MKEQFRSKRFQKKIRIKYKKEDGIYQWEADTYQILAMCLKITEEYMKMNIKITLRQLYYDLVSANAIPNHDKIYKKISNLLTDARYCGLIDWNAIEDRNRPSSMHSEWDDVHDLMQSAIHSYRLPRWVDQRYYVECFTEKDALSSIIEPICERWHIRFNVNKGYSSASIMYRLSKRLAQKIMDEKDVVLIYIGDHDPSGLDMIRDINTRVKEFLEDGNDYYDTSLFNIEHIALTMQQVREFNPPPNPAKITDPRAKWYISRFGRTSWEVEALKADYLINLLNNKIQDYVDIKKYNAWLKQEKEEKEEMKKFADEYKGRGKAN